MLGVRPDQAMKWCSPAGTSTAKRPPAVASPMKLPSPSMMVTVPKATFDGRMNTTCAESGEAARTGAPGRMYSDVAAAQLTSATMLTAAAMRDMACLLFRSEPDMQPQGRGFGPRLEADLQREGPNSLEIGRRQL